MGHVSRKHCEEIMMKFCYDLISLDRLQKLVNKDRDILTSVPLETLFLLADLAFKDFRMQPTPGMRGHPICLGPNEVVRQRVARVDQLNSEVYILFSATY
jgi:hypothetical protein